MNLVETKTNPGQTLSLTAKSPLPASANSIREIGLSWDFKDGKEIDVDIWCAYLAVAATDPDTTAGKLDDLKNLYFYHNVDGRGIDPDSKSDVVYAAYGENDRDAMLTYARTVLAPQYPIVITKDQRDGKATGFDEILFINESLLEVNRRILVAVNIYEWQKNNLNFSAVPGLSISFPDGQGSAVVYDLQKNPAFDLETGCKMAYIWKTSNGDIRMQAIDNGGFSKSLQDFAASLQ